MSAHGTNMATFALHVAHLSSSSGCLGKTTRTCYTPLENSEDPFSCQHHLANRPIDRHSLPQNTCRASSSASPITPRTQLDHRSAQSTWGTRPRDQPVRATSSSSKQTDPLRPSAMSRGAVSPRDLPTCSPALRSAPTIVAGATHHRRLRLTAWECSSQSM
jgi:hypothetical protein